jgi:hypothetical protein
MKILILPFLLLPLLSSASSTKDLEEARETVTRLIGQLLQKKITTKSVLKKFSVEHCEKHKINWSDLFLSENKVSFTYAFRPGCDIEGTIYPAMIKPFAANLNLRHLEKFHRIETMNKVTGTLEAKPILTLNMTEGRLLSPQGIVRFEADYRVRLDPLQQGKDIEENLGGEIRINEIYGRKTAIKEKLIIK